MNSEQKLNLDQLQRADAKHHQHPFTDTKEINEQGTRVIVKADGVSVLSSIYAWLKQHNDGANEFDGSGRLLPNEGNNINWTTATDV